MPLSCAEKIAGRQFRDAAQAKLLATFDGEKAPTYTAPNFLGIYRHNCPARQGRSTGLVLDEIYTPSPECDIFTDDGSREWVAPGRFGFIYREGRCRGCGQTARSKAGRLVDGWVRPPIHGRVARS